MLRVLVLASLLAAGLATPARADDAIPGIGHLPDIPGAQEKPDPELDYKIVFDIRTLAKSAQINLSATVTFRNLRTRGCVKMQE